MRRRESKYRCQERPSPLKLLCMGIFMVVCCNTPPLPGHLVSFAQSTPCSAHYTQSLLSMSQTQGLRAGVFDKHLPERNNPFLFPFLNAEPKCSKLVFLLASLNTCIGAKCSLVSADASSQSTKVNTWYSLCELVLISSDLS